MKKLLIAQLACVFVAGAILVAATPAHAPKVKKARAAVTVVLEDGHGSGVHIGHGNILTAAHVTTDKDTGKLNAGIKVRDANGTEHAATVLWANPTYDVSIIHIDDADGIESRRLTCRPLVDGEALTLEGAPFNFGAVISWGHVSRGEAKPFQHWALSSLVDAQMGPGMSGGPAYDHDGNVVGINVGGYPGFGVNVIVPGEAICRVMART